MDLKIRNFAKGNRTCPTQAEKKLWRFLRDRRLGGYKFRRQHLIAGYIADFVCLEAGIVIGLDGGYHGSDTQWREDKKRTVALEKQGFRVLRFRNGEVLDEIGVVLNTILFVIEEKPEGER